MRGGQRGSPSAARTGTEARVGGGAAVGVVEDHAAAGMGAGAAVGGAGDGSGGFWRRWRPRVRDRPDAAAVAGAAAGALVSDGGKKRRPLPRRWRGKGHGWLSAPSVGAGRFADGHWWRRGHWRGQGRISVGLWIPSKLGRLRFIYLTTRTLIVSCCMTTRVSTRRQLWC